MQNNFEFTDKKQVFAQRYTGEYSTRKVINRSAKAIPEHYINEIEAGNVTSAMLEDLNKIVPVFVYKTCVTVHGNLPEININRIGGYKNVIQNGNGSVEFRYSAIDNKLKKELAIYLQGHYRQQGTSTNGIYFELSKTFDERTEALQYLQEQKTKVEGLNITGMKANIFVQGYSYFGRYYIITTIIPLLITGNLLSIAVELTGEAPEAITNRVAAAKAEQEQRNNEWKERQIKAAQVKEVEEAEREKMEAILRQRHAPTTIHGEGTYLTVCKTINGLKYQLIQTYKGTFGRLSYKYKFSSTPDNFEGELKEGRNGKQMKAAEITNKPVFRYY